MPVSIPDVFERTDELILEFRNKKQRELLLKNRVIELWKKLKTLPGDKTEVNHYAAIAHAELQTAKPDLFVVCANIATVEQLITGLERIEV